MTNMGILFGLVIYMLAVLGVGIYASRYMKSLDDFVLGGRRLSPWVAALSERASGESAWFLLGLPGACYALGFAEFWSVIGIAFGIFISWVLIALPLRVASAKLGALTLPDYFELRFGDKSRILRIVSMVIILVFYTVYVSAQFVGAGKVLHATFGIPTAWGMIIGAFIVALYTILGGFIAVAWTDVIQGILMMAVAVILPIVGIFYLGGVSETFSILQAKEPAFFSMSGGKVGHAMWFGVILGGLGWGLGYLGQPHLLTRYMAIKNPREVRKGTLIATGWVLISYWGAAFIGIVGAAVFGAELADKETIMPLMATKLLPGWLAGVFISGAIAAMMSTADSQLVVATSALSEDIYARLIHPDAEPKKLVALSRIAAILVTVVALLFAFFNKDFIFDIVAYSWSGLGSSFGPPLVLALLWKRTTRSGVLCGMLGGMFGTILWKNVAALQSALDMKVASFLIALLLTILVSLFTRPPEPETIEKGTLQASDFK